MAKSKQELLNEADKLGLALSVKNTVAEIEAAIANAAKTTDDKEITTASGAKISEENTTEIKAEDVSPDLTDEISEEEKAHFAKAGKRSQKTVREDEAETARQERKAEGDTTAQDGKVANDSKGPAPKTRPRIERHGKKFREIAKKIDFAKSYSLAEALKLATETAPTKFDSTVEIHVRLGVDPKQADQNVRATVSLPNGTGKTVRVAAMVPEADAEATRKAGADIAGEAEIIALLDKENITFDVLIATPAEMPKLGKYARLLGPRGLMPNPKAGTVSTNPAQAVKEAKAGKIEFRVDKQSIVHAGVGKVSFGADKLLANVETFLAALNAAKPNSLKGTYILSLTISTTMGPGVKVDFSNL